MRPLNEVEFKYLSNVVDDLSAYAGQGYFVHFGETPKVGVNPRPFHSDPRGVYCYGVDWLLNNPKFYNAGSQYAVNRPYWSIIRLVSDQGIVLSKFKQADLEALADRNGFRDELTRFLEQSSLSLKTAPEALWAYLRNRTSSFPSVPINSEIKPLRGIDFIYDDGLGIIHQREANQIALFNPKAYKIVDSGVQANKQEAYHNNAVINIMKHLQLRYGGDLSWMKKSPKLVIDRGYTRFEVTVDKESSQPYMRIKMNWGRAEKRATIRFDEIEPSSNTFASLVGRIEDMFDLILRFGKAKRDLFFQPSIDPKEALQELRKVVGEGYSFETLIENDVKEVTVTATKEFKTPNGVSFLAVIACRINDDENDTRWIMRLAVNSHTVAQARVIPSNKYPHSKELGILIKKGAGELLRQTDWAHPSKDHESAFLRRFHYDSEYNEFIGWVVNSAGLRLLSQEYDEQVNQYRKLSDDDRSYLMREIKRVF